MSLIIKSVRFLLKEIHNQTNVSFRIWQVYFYLDNYQNIKKVIKVV